MTNPVDLLAMTDENSFKAYLARPEPRSLDLSGEKFESRSFSGWELQNVKLSGGSLNKCDLSRCLLNGAQMERLTLQNSRLESAILTNANLNHSQLEGVDFSHAVMHNTHAVKITGKNLDFRDGDLINLNMPLGTFDGVLVFARANMRGALLHDSSLRGADFSGTNLEGANLTHSDLTNSDLRNANLCGAKLAGANVKGARITRLDIEDLRSDNLAGLRPSQLHEMNIEDGFGELRNYFSGFWTYIHLVSIVLWLTPLVWIIGRSLLLSIVPPAMEGKLYHLMLVEQIWGYWKSGRVMPTLVNGIPDYPFSWLFFITWTAILVYNVARFFLVLRVKLWEHKQAITGLHPDVTIEGGLNIAFKAVAYLFYVNLLIVLGHFINFLTSKFPILPTQ